MYACTVRSITRGSRLWADCGVAVEGEDGVLGEGFLGPLLGLGAATVLLTEEVQISLGASSTPRSPRGRRYCWGAWGCTGDCLEGQNIGTDRMCVCVCVFVR
jgi:hypothetical protein